MKALIIEDEEISFRRLRRMLQALRPDMEIDGLLTTTSEVISRLSEYSGYDIIFSDIRLRDHDVFDAFQAVMPECMVIFTTAYDEYALKAFKNNGVEYLLKPIEKESLSAALKKVESLAGQKAFNKDKLDTVVGELRTYRERILIWKGDELIPVNVKDILYFYFDQRHVYAKLADGDANAVQFTMSELENGLDPRMFFRLNRQYIANIGSIARISLFFNSRLRIRLKGCDQPLTLSKEKSAELREWLDR